MDGVPSSVYIFGSGIQIDCPLAVRLLFLFINPTWKCYYQAQQEVLLR